MNLLEQKDWIIERGGGCSFETNWLLKIHGKSLEFVQKFKASSTEEIINKIL